jgi:glucose/arabinose dehydrogenase
MRRRTLLALAVIGPALLAGCDHTERKEGSPAKQPTTQPPATAASGTPGTHGAPGTLSVIATGLNVPWALAFLPGGDALVTERETGRILRVPAAGGKPIEVIRIPDVATDTAEGGLLGVAVPASYPSDGLVYAYYTTRTDNRIVRFRLGDSNKGSSTQAILTGLRKGTIHNGGRIAFGPDGKLYAGVGETGDRGLAQDRSARNGKILRMNPDGSVPADNPFAGSLVWSYGHRNVQGLAWDSAGRLWATEFGQDRFDEINLIQPGRNYGWPNVEGTGDTQNGRYANPLVTWTTAEASPSGAAIVGNTLYVGALRGQALLRVNLNGDRASKGTSMLKGQLGRIRAVAAAPDGTVWITTSNRDGRGSPRSDDDRILSLTV